MKLLTFISVTLLMGGTMTLPAHASETTLKIRSLFNIKQAYCSIKTNGVKGLDNRKSAYHGRGGGISSTNSLLFLENGENEISLEIGALGWFSDQNLDDSERGKFDALSSCKLELVRFEGQKKIILTTLNVTVNKDGLPDLTPDDNAVVTRQKIIAEQVVPGHIDPEYFGERYFPENMVLYEFSEKTILTGIPEWAWTKATPYTGSEEQIKKLRDSYLKLAEIINMHDRTQLKKSHNIALHAWAKTTGDNEDAILLSQYSKSDIEEGKVKIDPINWNDYSVRVMNKGRIVQFYNKSKPTYSPLTYHSTDSDGSESMGYYAPMFSLINGKFVVVI